MIHVPDSFVLVYAHGSPMLKSDTPMGSGVLVSKTIAGNKRLMLVTARHVAQAVAAMRGEVEVGFMARPKGVERKPVRNRIWLIDGEKDDDLAVHDRARTAKLMGDLGIPMGNHVIRHVSGTFPNSITCDGAEYSVERLEPQSVYFKISDKSGNEVARGIYSRHATECDARLEALDHADANHSLSVEEAEKRMSCEWLDDKKTILLLAGTSWMHCLANKEVVIVYPRKYDDRRSLFLALSSAMVK